MKKTGSAKGTTPCAEVKFKKVRIFFSKPLGIRNLRGFSIRNSLGTQYNVFKINSSRYFIYS